MDDNNNRAIAADQRATQLNSPLREWATAEGLIPQLSASLALVRPVSMSEDAAAEWLAVAAGELAGYSRLSVEGALSDARQRCTYHGQIVPHVIKYMEDTSTWRMGKPLERHLPNRNEARALTSSTVSGLIEGAVNSLRSRR